MKVVDEGHRYLLAHKDGGGEEVLQFFQCPERHIRKRSGVLNQEVLRVLIDRVKFLENEDPSPENEKILYHLRGALIEHECRALRRKNLKGTIEAEHVAIGSDGHFKLHGG